jgi:heat shock protein HslJ
MSDPYGRSIMQRSRFLILGVLLAAVLVSSCGGTSRGVTLDNTSWDLATIGGYSLISGSSITASFVGGEIRGNAGCNTYFGGYDLSRAGDFEVTDFAMTEMACLSPQGVMQQETNYMHYLTSAVLAVREGAQLNLRNAAGQDILVFIEAAE